MFTQNIVILILLLAKCLEGKIKVPRRHCQSDSKAKSIRLLDMCLSLGKRRKQQGAFLLVVP